MAYIAKPLVKNQSWIVTDGVTKVGNLESNGSGLVLNIGGRQHHFSTTTEIKRTIPLQFQRPPKPIKVGLPYAHWPTSGRTYNNMFDVKRKLHIYTKTKKSRCYYAAGWFKLQMSDSTWVTVFCPKYIFIQRYRYAGPFVTEDEAATDK